MDPGLLAELGEHEARGRGQARSARCRSRDIRLPSVQVASAGMQCSTPHTPEVTCARRRRSETKRGEGRADPRHLPPRIRPQASCARRQPGSALETRNRLESAEPGRSGVARVQRRSLPRRRAERARRRARQSSRLPMPWESASQLSPLQREWGPEHRTEPSKSTTSPIAVLDPVPLLARQPPTSRRGASPRRVKPRATWSTRSTPSAGSRTSSPSPRTTATPWVRTSSRRATGSSSSSGPCPG